MANRQAGYSFKTEDEHVVRAVALVQFLHISQHQTQTPPGCAPAVAALSSIGYSAVRPDAGSAPADDVPVICATLQTAVWKPGCLAASDQAA